MRKIKKEDRKLHVECSVWFLFALILCPGIISLFVGAILGYSFFALVVCFLEK